MQKGLFLILGLSLFLGKPLFSQEQESRITPTISAGYGLFSYNFFKGNDFNTVLDLPDNPKLDKVFWGENVYMNVGVKLSNGFRITGGLNKGALLIPYNDPLGIYWEEDRIFDFTTYVISFNREIIAQSNFGFTYGLGISFRKLIDHNIAYNLYEIYENGVLVDYEIDLPYAFSAVQWDIGMPITAGINYHFKNGSYAGLEFTGIALFGLGIENYYFSPVLGVTL